MLCLHIPRPHGLGSDAPFALIVAWAVEHPDLVRRSITRKEAEKLARERKVPVSSLDQFIQG